MPNAVSPFAADAQWAHLKSGLIELARREILSRYHQVVAATKPDGSLVTAADIEMQRQTQAFLSRHWPEFGFLGEEQTEEEQVEALCSTRGCWVLDPLDGTNNFVSGIPIFTVSLALVVEGKVEVGVVLDPLRDECFAARRQLGAELNGRPLRISETKERLSSCIAIVDFKRLSADLASRLATTPPYSSQRSIGSVALDWCWIAAGRGQLYCHGGQNIWDYAAGVLILEEAGGQSATFEGDAVFTRRVQKRSAIAATTPELFAAWSQWLRG